jgi:hypothetical protein
MSVTNPTLSFEPLLDELAAVLLVLVLAGAAALELVVLLLLLLLLLPHAASPRASAAVAKATRPTGLILPVTPSPFRQDRMGNHNLWAGRWGVA